MAEIYDKKIMFRHIFVFKLQISKGKSNSTVFMKTEINGIICAND